jgi:hypothetical protein
MKPIRIKSHQELDALLASIANDTVTASIHWQLHRQLLSAMTDWHAEMAQAWTFWSLTIRAHYDVTLFRLARLYDQHQGALGLPRLLATVQANVEVFDETRFRERLKDNPFVDSLAAEARKPDADTLAGDVALASSSDQLVERLVVARDKMLAHQDPRVPLGTLQHPTQDLTATDLEELLDRAARLTNRYTILFRATAYSRRIVGDDDYLTVLSYVREGMDRHERDVQEQIAKVEKGGAG